MKTPATLALTLLTALPMPAATQTILLGTSTPSTGSGQAPKGGASKGIYAVQLDSATGALGEPVLAAEAASPGFLVPHPNGRVIYALAEITADGKPGGGISAYTWENGKLTLLNQQPSGGAGLTHLAVDATGRAVVAASYGGGYVVSFPLGPDGSIGARSAFIKLEGPPGPNKVRQDKSYAHSTTISPDNRFVFVADLGLDRVFSFKLDTAAATLTPNDPAFTTITPGSGPRHSKFSRDGRFFYVLNEIDGSVTACSYDAARGVAMPVQHISTLPADFKVTDPDRAAEIRVHPNGRFVYTSNRGHDSIAVFAVNADGTLKLVEFAPCGGKHPRNFELSPDGAWLVCANRDSNNLVSFKVDPASGKLTATGSVVTVPQAICVLFAPGRN